MINQLIEEQVIKEEIQRVYSEYNLRDRRLLVIIPDNTRTAPVDLFFKLFHETFGRDVRRLDYLIALGTHPLLTEDEKLKRVGITEEERESIYKNINIMNHRWDKKETFVKIGSLNKREMGNLTEGLLNETTDIFINRAIFDYDTVLILGPVFPHEVVGFSGSNKYLFPGICGWNFIDTTHWLGALRTNLETIGIKDTPVRRIIDRAADFVKVPIVYFNLVVDDGGLKGLFVGHDSSAWSQAVKLSSRLHIKYLTKPLKRVLSIPSKRYEDFWTGAKAFYKIEPAVEDGGEVIIYAPHISQFSITHGETIEKLGFHTKDYFLSNVERYKGLPKSVMAYCSLVKGYGYHKNGIERTRINIVLSTGISKDRCEKVNIAYMSPEEIDLSAWEGREDEGVKVFYDSGEILYRIDED